MKTCDEVQESLSRYIDGELPSSDEPDMFVHAGGCPGCREFLRSSLALREQLQAGLAPAVPRRLDRRVRVLAGRRRFEAVGSRIRRLWGERLSVPVPALAGGLAVALLLFLAAVRLFSPGGTDAQQQTYIMTLEPVEVRGLPITDEPRRLQQF